MASEEDLANGIEELLRTEDWDSITVKTVMRKLEALLLPGQPEGSLKPQKPFIKVVRLPCNPQACAVCKRAHTAHTHADSGFDDQTHDGRARGGCRGTGCRRGGCGGGGGSSAYRGGDCGGHTGGGGAIWGAGE